jgi:hypothetical protein
MWNFVFSTEVVKKIKRRNMMGRTCVIHVEVKKCLHIIFCLENFKEVMQENNESTVG